jgi:penicillin amidase
MLASLADAFRDCTARMGAEPNTWAWGKLHHGYFEHPLSAVLGPQQAGALDIGPFAKGGSGSTPMHTGYRPSDFRIMHGASVRIVMDVGAWDNSVCLNAPGQSGDPRSPHYRDLAPVWADHGYVPMLYSAEAVDRETVVRITLQPG